MAGRVLIIGAGIGALATAIRLAEKGFHVEVFEKNPGPGGKISEIRDKGYRFDTGPSLFTLPDLINELPGSHEPKLKYTRLSTISKYYFPDGKIFSAPGDPESFCNELASVIGVDENKVALYLDAAASLYELTAPIFIFSSFQRLNKLFKQDNLGVLKGMIKFNPGSSMHSFNRKTLNNDKAVQIFDRYATYNGSNPYKAPATLNIIAHLEHNLGAYFPQGGMYRIVKHLYENARKSNVTFHFENEVTEIMVENQRALGVIASGRKHNADIVVSGGDVFRTYRELMKKTRPPRTVRKPRYSSSAMIFYLGVKNLFSDLDVHNIFFSKNYRAEFASIFSKPTAGIYKDPTVYIYNSSKLEKNDAPPGCSNLYVMINVPADKGEDWNALSRDARRIIFEKLKREHEMDIEPRVEFEMAATPASIERDTLSTSGALYGNNSNSILSAFNRHPNFSRKIENLFFAGGSVHPGGGIPLCLASAKIVEEEIMLYHKKIKCG
ncbi:phytoene desaturase family protein [Bacteroidota bacterium]